MTAYLDAGFLLTILVRTSGTNIANALIRQEAPFKLNLLHQLQAENFLQIMKHSDQPQRQLGAAEGASLWYQYFAEGVLELGPADWNTAFRLAMSWNAQHQQAPPPPLLLLHPALARVAGATDFFSFDPRSRAVAKAAGLRLQPRSL